MIIYSTRGGSINLEKATVNAKEIAYNKIGYGA